MCCDEATGAAVERVDDVAAAGGGGGGGGGELAVTVARGGGVIETLPADLVVACDGRYSALRQQLAPAVPCYGPPYVADFRIVAAGAPPPMEGPLWRVYNRPDAAALAAKCGA